MIYRFNTVPIRIPADLFAYFDKLFLNFTWKFKGPILAKTILNRNNSEDPHFPISQNLLESYTESRQCVFGIRVDIWITGIVLSVQK